MAPADLAGRVDGMGERDEMMAKRETLQQIAARLEPGVRSAFLASVANIKSDAQLALIVDAIAANDASRVLTLLNLDRGYFAPLDRGLTAAYQQAGDAVVAAWMAQATAAGVQVRAVFDARNPRAEQWIATQSSRLITEIVADQRNAVRSLMTANFEKGTSPRTTALDIVGRINKATGRREGGIIGLHSRDVASKTRAFDQLLSNPVTPEGKEQLQRYLGRTLRDKRFDGVVRKAIRTGQPISQTKARRMLVGMENKMLRRRGETIARTELLGSTNAAQNEGLAQMIESGKVRQQHVKSTWDTSVDGFERESHNAMDGQQQPNGKPFVSGDGFLLLHPGDRSLGAPAAEIINCRCVQRVDIDWIAEGAAQEQEFAL